MKTLMILLGFALFISACESTNPETDAGVDDSTSGALYDDCTYNLDCLDAECNTYAISQGWYHREFCTSWCWVDNTETCDITAYDEFSFHSAPECGTGWCMVGRSICSTNRSGGCVPFDFPDYF
jgi:hypothetical protein